MAKKHLKLKGTILILAAWVSGILSYWLMMTGKAPILYWAGIAGFCLFLCFGLGAFLQAYQQKKLNEIEKSNL